MIYQYQTINKLIGIVLKKNYVYYHESYTILYTII